MSVDVVKFAFVGGEVSKNYWGRSDLAKFDLALAIAENWFVDYHGGLSTCPGTELVDFIQHDTYPTKFFRFKFASNVANTNIVLFGLGYIRFIQDGAYVLEDEKTIDSITKANPGVISSSSHGYSAGDWFKFPTVGEMVELSGRTCQVGAVTADTFQVLDQFGNNLDTTNFTTYVSGGTTARVYTVASPFATEDLVDLRCHQVRDLLRLTHKSYPTYNLTRSGQTDWAIALEARVNTLTRVSGLVANAFTGGNFATVYVVTQVNLDGVESLPSDHAFAYSSDQTGGATLVWTPLSDVSYYKVYRSRVVRSTTPGAGATRGLQVGYIGQTRAAAFVDAGYITPDFSLTPPQGNNPFVHGKIEAVNVLSAGTGYTNNSIITVTDPNPAAGGFVGFVIIQSEDSSTSRPIAGVYIIDGGHDYTSPQFSVNIGTGAVLSATLSEASGNNPGISTVYQQRAVYGQTDNDPLTVFGSRPGQLSNFNVSDVLLANDSYEHEVDSEDVSPLNHLVPTRGGLLAFSPAGIWLLAGSQGNAITATNVQADPQSYKGASDVPPLGINTEILYCEASGGKAMLLTYNDIAKLYAGVDLSLLANHMISKTNQIKHWAYADEPFKMVWAQRQDGVMLNLTIIREQEVFAWTRRTTQGKFLDVISLEEETSSSVYVMVERLINDRKTKFIERVTNRDFTNIEDAFCVDCGLRLGVTYPEADLQVDKATGTGIRAQSNQSPFVPGDVGKIIRLGGGKMRILTVENASEVTVNIVRDITSVIPFLLIDGAPYPYEALSGEWTMDRPVTTVSGLHHLEGETVSVLADGNVIKNLVVSDGAVTLPKAATRIAVGLGYRCLAQNLPLVIPEMIVENKRKRLTGIAMRLLDTRGLKAGNSLTSLYELKSRTSEAYGEPTVSQDGVAILPIEPIWSEDTQSFLVQDDPLPATVLGYVLEPETGDDTK